MKTVEWIIFVTTNYKKMKQFYETGLALPIIKDVPDEEFTQFQAEYCYIAIYGKPFVEKLIGQAVTGKPGSTIYTWKESADIDDDYEKLKANGVQFITEPKTQTWGQRTAYFTDPDGNIWEIQKWIKK
jgi:uncharacterized glyoxalase superfamily protein PhnB